MLAGLVLFVRCQQPGAPWSTKGSQRSSPSKRLHSYSVFPSWVLECSGKAEDWPLRLAPPELFGSFVLPCGDFVGRSHVNLQGSDPKDPSDHMVRTINHEARLFESLDVVVLHSSLIRPSASEQDDARAT